MVPYKFKDCFSVSVKNTIGILVGIVLNLYIALGRIDILTLFFQFMTQDIFPFICVFNFFYQCFMVPRLGL